MLDPKRPARIGVMLLVVISIAIISTVVKNVRFYE